MNMLTVVAPTDAQLAYITSLCEDRGLEPPAVVAEALTDAEYAYIIGKLGEGGPARLFGV